MDSNDLKQAWRDGQYGTPKEPAPLSVQAVMASELTQANKRVAELQGERDELKRKVQIETEHHEFYRSKVSDFMGANLSLIGERDELRAALEAALPILTAVNNRNMAEWPNTYTESDTYKAREMVRAAIQRAGGAS